MRSPTIPTSIWISTAVMNQNKIICTWKGCADKNKIGKVRRDCQLEAGTNWVMIRSILLFDRVTQHRQLWRHQPRPAEEPNQPLHRRKVSNDQVHYSTAVRSLIHCQTNSGLPRMMSLLHLIAHWAEQRKTSEHIGFKKSEFLKRCPEN